MHFQFNIHGEINKNSSIVEHKINFLLILFDFRDTGSLNIVEIIIMAHSLF